MRIWLMIVSLFLGLSSLSGQGRASTDSSYATAHYQQRLQFFLQMPDQKNEIVFLGNSITEQGEWQELLPGRPVVNRGIGGDNTFGVLARLGEIVSSRPQKIFLLIGINDIGRGLPDTVITRNYQRIIETIRRATPRTELYIQSLVPLNDSLLKFDYLKGKNEVVRRINRELKKLSDLYRLTFVDLQEVFCDDQGELKASFTTDGIHLKSIAYLHWVEYLKQKKLL